MTNPKSNEQKPATESENSTQNLTVYILKRQAGGLKAAEQYLSHRVGTLGGSHNLKDAVVFLVQKSPKVVLIPCDHPNKKVKMLPKLIMQAFPTTVVGYSESPSPSAFQALQEMNLEYVLYPPISGPTIERILLRILRDEEKKKRGEGSADLIATGKTGLDGGPLVFSNDKTDSGNASINFNQARQALQNLIAIEGNNPKSNGPIMTGMSEGSQASGSGFGFPTGTASQNTSTQGIYNPQSQNSSTGGSQGQNSTGFNYPQGQSSSNAGFGYPQGQNSSGSGLNGPYGSNPMGQGALGQAGGSPGRDANGNPVNPGHQGSASGLPSMGGSQPESPNYQGPGSLNSSQAPFGGSQAGQHGGGPSYSNPQSSNPNADSDKPKYSSDVAQQQGYEPPPFDPVLRKNGKDEDSTAKQNSPYSISHGSGFTKNSGPETIMVRGTEEALESSVVSGKQAGQTESLKKIQNAVCITVESTRFNGYLIAAANNLTCDEDLFECVRKKLFEFLRAHGEQIQEEKNSMPVKLQEVSFEDWALEQAQFLKKAIHNGSEVAVAFFPTMQTKSSIEESSAEHMVKMNLSEFKADTVVEFDVYIHLNANNKFLLYTPTGRTLYKDQMDRLSEKGVKHLHLLKEASHQVARYRAQNYLNDKIQEFRSRSVA